VPATDITIDIVAAICKLLVRWPEVLYAILIHQTHTHTQIMQSFMFYFLQYRGLLTLAAAATN